MKCIKKTRAVPYLSRWGIYWSVVLLLSLSGETFAGARPWIPSDSVGVRYFSILPNEYWLRFADDAAIWQFTSEARQGGINSSPDGRFFFVVSTQGDLQQDRTVTTLQV